MRLPLATLKDLQDELAELDDLLTRMDAAVIVDAERWENLRQERLDRRRDVLRQIAAGDYQVTA